MAKDKTTSGRGMMSMPGTSMKVRADRYRTSYAPGDYAKSRQPAPKSGMISLPGTAMKVLGQRFLTKYAPGDYAAYRKTLAVKKPAAPVKKPQVISNVVRVGGKSSPVKSAAEARSMKPGNYGSGKVSMGGKTYTGFTVSESKGRSGQTTKSVGNWTSTKDAGRSLGKSGVAGPSRGGVSTGKTTGKTSSSAGGGRARGGGSR